MVSDNPLQLPASEAAYSPVISPDGEWLLVTSNAMKGLQKYDLATGQLETITTDNGAGYNAKISNDGSTIVYRTSEFKNRLRYFSVKSVDVATGKTETVVKPTRNVSAFGAVNGTALAVGLSEGLYEEKQAGRVQEALKALALSLRRKAAQAAVDGSLGECRGFSEYPQIYGAYPWGTGTVLRFLAETDGEI